jgi:hypothetical protein
MKHEFHRLERELVPGAFGGEGEWANERTNEQTNQPTNKQNNDRASE